MNATRDNWYVYRGPGMIDYFETWNEANEFVESIQHYSDFDLSWLEIKSLDGGKL